jgi:hypothetical protein
VETRQLIAEAASTSLTSNVSPRQPQAQ